MYHMCGHPPKPHTKGKATGHKVLPWLQVDAHRRGGWIQAKQPGLPALPSTLALSLCTLWDPHPRLPLSTISYALHPGSDPVLTAQPPEGVVTSTLACLSVPWVPGLTCPHHWFCTSVPGQSTLHPQWLPWRLKLHKAPSLAHRHFTHSLANHWLLSFTGSCQTPSSWVPCSHLVLGVAVFQPLTPGTPPQGGCFQVQ